MRTARVTVVPYDAAWPGEFEKIRAEAADALGRLALAVEHVGSTSVPGLWAKPVIDLDVVIEDEDSLPAVIERLAAIGYRHEGDLGIAGREAFRYDAKPHLMTHHLYVCPRRSPELARHLALRDYLRAHPDAAAEYAAVKREGARRYPDDIDAYIEHKSAVIRAIYRACGLV